MNGKDSHPGPPLLCGGCDLLMTNVEPPPGHTVRCPRCGRRLHKWKTGSIEKTLAISLTGLLLYLPANFMPLLTFDILGMNTSASLFTSTLSMFHQGQHAVGILIVLCGFLLPLLLLSLFFSVSLALARGRQQPWIAHALKYIHHLREWAMPDVYLIGIFVTIIKMSHMADIDFNIGLFCFIGLVLTTIGCQSAMDSRLFWAKLDPDNEPSLPGTFQADTGAAAGLCLCHSCNKVIPIHSDQPTLPNYSGRQGRTANTPTPARTALHQSNFSSDHQQCPRCGEHLHLRKKNSLSRTWALLITAVILTLPANILPIMEVDYFGVPDQSTIMDGIIHFFKEGSYGIGTIILTASILVPLFKIIGLLLILVTIHFRLPGGRKHKAIMLRFIEFIGRWSMLDIFVIALLCALVRFGFLSTINAAPAVFYFAGVVICTMLAAISFDPRLLWDTTAQPTQSYSRHAEP